METVTQVLLGVVILWLAYELIDSAGGNSGITVPGTGGESVSEFASLLPRDIGVGVALGLLVLAI
ncbi:MAG TPA: hypothetical protein VMU24_02295 [Candidatus Acidoferrales bacterium]|nr:hypothetical protein [Candidatus Acidoferrales bacterium]